MVAGPLRLGVLSLGLQPVHVALELQQAAGGIPQDGTQLVDLILEFLAGHGIRLYSRWLGFRLAGHWQRAPAIGAEWRNPGV